MNTSVLTTSSHLPLQDQKCGIYKIWDIQNLGYTKQTNKNIKKKTRTKNLSIWKGMRSRGMMERLDLSRKEGRKRE